MSEHRLDGDMYTNVNAAYVSARQACKCGHIYTAVSGSVAGCARLIARKARKHQRENGQR